MQTQVLLGAGGAIAGFKVSQKWGDKLPGGNIGKCVAGAGIAFGGHYAPDALKAPVIGFGVGVLADGLLSFVNL